MKTELATGIKITDNDTHQRAGNKLVSNLSLSIASLPLIKTVCLLYHKNGSGKDNPDRSSAAFDATGAGDMVLSMFGMVVGSGHGFEEACSHLPM